MKVHRMKTQWRHTGRKVLGMARLIIAVWIGATFTTHAAAEVVPTNLPPKISFLWPVNRPGVWPANAFSFGFTTPLKFKAGASDPDGSIREVRFYAGTNLLGTVTNSPFNLLWEAIGFRRKTIKAVAVDNLGAESHTIAGDLAIKTGLPPEAYAEIVWPPNGAMFAAPATFEFAVEVMAGGSTGPIDFLVDGTFVGRHVGYGAMMATTPPSILIVTNLSEGNHVLGFIWQGAPECFRCGGVTNNIRVVRLGMHSARVLPDGARQFEVATSYGGKLHVLEASRDLVDWCTIAITNAPATNSFTFVVPHCDRPDDRYYRVLVPEPQ